MVFTKVGNDDGTLHVEYYESNLHKEGCVDLTLSNPADAEKIHDEDTVEIPGVCDCVSGEEVDIVVHHPDCTEDIVHANIT